MTKETTIAEAMAQAAGNSAADLVRQNWTEIENAFPDSGKLTVSLSLKLKKNGAGYKQTAKISFGSKITDEREDSIDPSQSDLL